MSHVVPPDLISGTQRVYKSHMVPPDSCTDPGVPTGILTDPDAARDPYRLIHSDKTLYPSASATEWVWFVLSFNPLPTRAAH